MTVAHHDHPHDPGTVHPEDLDLYALHALPHEETESVERALDGASPAQRESMLKHIASTREVAASLVESAGLDSVPPPGLRARILERAASERADRARADRARENRAGEDGAREDRAREDEAREDGASRPSTVTDLGRERARRRPGWTRTLTAAAAAVALLAGGVAIGRITDDGAEGSDGRPPVAAPSPGGTPAPVRTLLAARDLEVVQGPVGDAATATVLASQSADMAMITMFGLPELQQGRAYQLWLMGPDHDPIPSGTMEADELGPSASAELRGIRRSTQIGVTEEPAGGSPAPTGDVLAALDLA